VSKLKHIVLSRNKGLAIFNNFDLIDLRRVEYPPIRLVSHNVGPYLLLFALNALFLWAQKLIFYVGDKFAITIAIMLVKNLLNSRFDFAVNKTFS